ncbi:MAG: MFS transporter [Novosphingobium sp.]|nr:MFS transporter [Novosphingobium sp.]
MTGNALEEWKQHWPLVLSAAMGCSAAGLSLYSPGPFVEPISAEFGWNRATFALGSSVGNIGAALFALVVGRMIDRLGPRITGISGVIFVCMTVSLMGTSTGSVANWLILWTLLTIGATWVQATVWTSAVATRFDKSRGLAFAMTISGTGLAAAILPLVATWLIEEFGWRKAYPGIGLIWAVVVIPILLLFFRGEFEQRKKGLPPDRDGPSPELNGLTLAEGLRSRTFHKLAAAAMLFVFCVISLIFHMVPLLQDHDLDRVEAASIAGLVGLVSIAGRLTTGFLLDRFRADRVAMVAFALPLLASLIFLFTTDIFLLAIAASLIGFSLGAELDATLYLATRHFGLKSFGSLFSFIFLAFVIGTAAGPLVAGILFDEFGSYTPFLILVCPVVLVASLLVGSLGPYPEFEPAQAPPTH